MNETPTVTPRRPITATVALAIVIALLVACGAPGAAPSDEPRTPSAATATTPIASATPSPTAPSAPDDAAGPVGSPMAEPRTGESLGAPPASPSAGPSTPAAAASPAALPAAEPFALSLYRRGDFVAQYTFEWCVGASLQMALRIVGKSDDRTKVYQQELWEMARDRSFSPFGGANPRGWTASLNDLGIGPYELVSIPTYDEALRVAAAALRATERPVGLVMWRGRHAWVMSGFESIGDPRTHEDFRVTGVRVLDPLHPHGSAAWGPSPAPNSLLTPETLAKQFVLRDSRRVNLGVPPGYLLVLPTA